MQKSFWPFILLLAVLVQSGSLSADSTASLIHRFISHYQQKHQVPGVLVVLYDKGSLSYFSFGVANEQTKQPITAKTIFELGSITKSFTAILLAAETLKGHLQLETPLAESLPGLKGFNGPIAHVTLLQLATHTSGLPRTAPFKNPNLPQLVAFLKRWEPSKTPGTQYHYSNLGFGLLGLSIENALQNTYIKLLKDNILTPLKMNNTFIAVPPFLKADIAQGYKKNGSPAEPWPATLIAAAGALRSTGEDMGKFLAACLNLRGTPKSVARAIALTEQGGFKVDPHKTQVMSWMKTTKEGYTIFAKNGGVTGFATFMGFIPEFETGIVILANKNVSNTSIGQKILQQLASAIQKNQ